MMLEKIIIRLIYVIINVISLYTTICFFETRLNIKTIDIWKKRVIYLTYIIINSFLISIVNLPIINIIIQFSILWTMSKMFSDNINHKTVTINIYMCITITVEFIIGYVMIYMLNTDLEIASEIFSFNLIGMGMSRIVTLMVIKFIQYYFPKNINKRLNFIEMINLTIIPLCSIVLMQLLNFISLKLSASETILIIISAVLLIVINVVFYILLDKVYRTEQIKYEGALLKEQSDYYIEKQKDLENNYNSIITIKHNLNHKLLYLKEKIDNIDKEKFKILEEEIENIIGETLNVDVVSYTKNISVNTILSYKLDTLTKNNIPVDIKVNVGEKLAVDEKMLYILLGNLFDNIVENFDLSNSKQKETIIRIYEENENLYIKFSNPYNHSIKLKDGIPITRKKDVLYHGIGIKSIKELLSQNNGMLRIVVNNNIFITEVVLFKS